jgi:hypothetical protein
MRPDRSDREMFDALVRSHVGTAVTFELDVLPDGSRRIKGPYATACYPAATWVERFGAHLRQGLFTRPPRRPAVARHPAPASGGTGP